MEHEHFREIPRYEGSVSPSQHQQINSESLDPRRSISSASEVR